MKPAVRGIGKLVFAAGVMAASCAGVCLAQTPDQPVLIGRSNSMSSSRLCFACRRFFPILLRLSGVVRFGVS